MTGVNFFALGGQDEKGKNCYILEDKNSIFMIDIGVKHPVVSILGVDTIIPNFEYLKKHLNHFYGVFISSGHDESIAALPWLIMQIKNVKIYTSYFIAQLIKNRLTKYQIQESDYQIIIIKDQILINGMLVKIFPVASSMPETIGFNFQTSEGDIIYMSNYVLNNWIPHFGITDLHLIKKTISNKGLLALAVDASTSNYHGYSSEKAKIRPLIEKKISKNKSNTRIIIGCYDEEMATVQEILQLAIDYNKPVVLYGRSYATSLEIFKKEYPTLKLPQLLDYREINNYNELIILVTGTGSRLYQRMDRIAENKDIYLKLKPTDLVIMIAPPINGHEKFASRAEDKIAEITPNLLDIARENFFEVKPASDDIKKTIEILKPHYIFPIRALYRYLLSTKKLALDSKYSGDKIIILQNGKKAYFANKKLISQNKKISNINEVIIDGLGIGDIAPSVIYEREKLATNGVLILTFSISKKDQRKLGELSIKAKGVITSNELNDYRDLFENNIEETLEKLSDESNFKHSVIQNEIRKKIQKIVRKQLHKTPIIIINIFEV